MASNSKPTTEVDLSGFGLERLQHIGRGQYASAQHVRETATGQTYVAKCISLAALNEHDQDLAHQEVFLLQTLSHPYIVAYRDSFLIDGANTLVIVMEYCDHGDLRKAIKEKSKAGEHFPEEQIMTWFVQLCLALQYIHSEKVLHRDLKTSNIFLADGGATIKLGDFGISRVLEGTTEAAVTIVGTPYYMSPEVCRSEPYNWKSDIWALGCVLYELCMLKHAFESSSLLGLVYKIVSDHYEPIPSFYSPQLNDLIHQLLAKNAEQRPSINEVFANPYVKAYLMKQAVPTPAPPETEPPPLQPKRASLRPGAKASPPAAAASQSAPPVPGPAELGSQSRLLVIASRIRRRLVGQKLNWISAFAAFDLEGVGALSPEALGNALTTMHLGLSEDEMSEIANGLAQASGGTITLDAFGAYMKDVPPEVHQHETWARQILAPSGKRMRELLHAKDSEQRGTLPPAVFQAALKELAPMVTAPQVDLLLLLADKNALGDVDYGEFISAFAPPLAPPPGPGAGATAAPPGMPPLPGAPAAAAPPGMPPLPGPGPGPAAPVNLDASASIIDLGFERTFFTCTSNQFPGVAAAACRALSSQGCALIFARIRRRLEVVGLSFVETMMLFNAPGEQELSAEQWLDVASTLPLGTSRAEMQQVFSKVDSEGAGKVALSTLEAAFSRSASVDPSSAPPWTSGAKLQALCGRLAEELPRLSGGQGLARESDFRRVVMQTERYLTADQLNSLVLLTDKSSDGHVDFVEFSERFGGGPRSALRVPGGALPAWATTPSTPGGGAAAVPATEDEVRVVGARTASVLERQGVAAECVPAMLALWSGGSPDELAPAVAAALLAAQPLGLSRGEAEGLLLAAGGSAAAVAALLTELRAQGVWKARCDWAASCVPGQALRTVLQRQVADAESRSLEPAEFARALADAGVAPGNVQPVMWLAEKSAQGDVRVAEFLALFGGAAPATAKKKRGMWSRFMGR